MISRRYPDGVNHNADHGTLPTMVAWGDGDMASAEEIRVLADRLKVLQDATAADVLYYEQVEDEDYHRCLRAHRQLPETTEWIIAMLQLSMDERWQVWELAYPDATPLTVKEFIVALQSLPADLPVLFMDLQSEQVGCAEAAMPPEIRSMAMRVRAEWETPWTYHAASEDDFDAGITAGPFDAVILRIAGERRPRWHKVR